MREYHSSKFDNFNPFPKKQGRLTFKVDIQAPNLERIALKYPFLKHPFFRKYISNGAMLFCLSLKMLCAIC